MPVEIRNVSADIRLPAEAPPPPASSAPPGGTGSLLDNISDAELRDRLGPIFMDVFDKAVEALRHRHG